MNAKNHRVKLNISPLDFPPINGLGMSSVLTLTETPKISNGKLDIKISKTFLLTDSYTKKEHEILKVQSVYEIPISEIISNEDLYELYKDASLNFQQAYQYAQSKIPLPSLNIEFEPIKNYEKEFKSIFIFISSLN